MSELMTTVKRRPIPDEGGDKRMKTETFELGVGDTCSINQQTQGCNIKGPATIIVLKKETAADATEDSESYNCEKR